MYHAYHTLLQTGNINFHDGVHVCHTHYYKENILLIVSHYKISIIFAKIQEDPYQQDLMTHACSSRADEVELPP